MNQYIMDLAEKNGRNIKEMPTALGKPLGDCTTDDLQQLQERYSRLADIHGRMANGKEITSTERQLIKNDEAHEAVMLAWALGRGA